MVHGYEAAADFTKTPNIWAHAYTGSVSLSESTSYSVNSYFAFGAFIDENTPMTAGTIAHELGHDAFDFIDVYDYGKSDDYDKDDGKARGVDNWSLMGSGNWSYIEGEGPIGSCPTPIDAYNLLRIKEPVSEKSDDIAQNFSLRNPWEIMKVTNSVKPSQYFLLQPRGNVGYDRGLLDGKPWSPTQSGLLIYHVDEKMKHNDWNDHPLVDIEEAHGGKQDLQIASGGHAGSPSDLFSGATKRSFGRSTDPNSNLYDSDSTTSQKTPSGVRVSDITSYIDAQNVIASFVVGGGDDDDEEGGGGGCDTGTFALAGLFAMILAAAASRGKIRNKGSAD
jgi:hypothetical protein